MPTASPPTTTVSQNVGPSVSVKIGERHFGQPVIDPAAQTELGLILQQCGFTLVDDKSKERADVEITGDAFSAARISARQRSVLPLPAGPRRKVTCTPEF